MIKIKKMLKNMMMNMMKKYKNDDEADYEYYHEDAIFLDNHEQQSDRIR